MHRRIARGADCCYCRLCCDKREVKHFSQSGDGHKRTFVWLAEVEQAILDEDDVVMPVVVGLLEYLRQSMCVCGAARGG